MTATHTQTDRERERDRETQTVSFLFMNHVAALGVQKLQMIGNHSLLTLVCYLGI